MKGVKNWTIDCLKRAEMGCRKGGQKAMTLRVIELSSDGDDDLLRFYLSSVKVEEYGVFGVDGKCPQRV